MKPSKPTTISALCLLLGALAASHAQAQSTNVQLSLEPRTNGLRLHYSLANTNGAFFFLQSGQLTNLLGAGQVINAGIAASNPVGALDVPLPTNAVSFFGLVQDPTLSVSPEDFIPDLEGPEDAPNLSAMFIESTNLPNVLAANSPFPLTLKITDIAGNLIPTNGQITLSLETADGTSVGFAYALSPSTIGVTNGIGQTVLTIQTTNSLAGVFLAGKFTGQFNGGAAMRNAATTGTQVSQQSVSYANYSDPDTISWQYPLSSVYPLSGAFGEWPGHSDLHYGIDFAAPVGASVLAAKKGVVIQIGQYCGQDQIIVIYHGNGYVTRYLHIVPTVKRGDIVQKSAVIGKVGNFSCVAHHLHFELRALSNSSFYNQDYNYKQLYAVSKPGSAVNPVGNPAFTFSSPLFNSGGQIPSVKAVFFRSTHPALNALEMNPASPCLERLSNPNNPSPSPVYVVLQVVESVAGNVLPPKQITFTPDVGPAQQIVYGLTSAEIDKIHPRDWIASNGPGYALLPDYESNPNTAKPYRPRRYKYWFQWDTSQYTSSPHSFTVQALDLAGNAANPVVFTFGPQILSVVPDPSIAGKFSFTNVSYLGTNSLPALTQPDRYKVEIIQANGSVLPGVIWGSPIVNGLTPDVTIHLKTNGYTFILPAATATLGLKLRVSSLLATNLAHQVEIAGMAFIPAGAFTMGDSLDGNSDALPLHTVYVSAFYMDKYEVTKALWDEVYNWATNHSYSFDNPGSWISGVNHSKGQNHPVHLINWYDCVKWCNARSEKEGKTPAYYTDASLNVRYRNGQVVPYVNWNAGYRLPTEAEWEKAARGGPSGQRFPWGNTISWTQANYYAYPSGYDVNSTSGFSPAYNDGVSPYTSPVGSFAANGYELYDMAGNVGEWCWDWYGPYLGGSVTDPRGPASGSDRVFRGNSWSGFGSFCRSAFRSFYYSPTISYDHFGFRSVLPQNQP